MRGLIALAATTGAMALIAQWTRAPIFEFSMRAAYAVTDDGLWVTRLTVGMEAIVMTCMAVPIALSVFALVSRCGRASTQEPCCRKCGYNLTGNVSGVCPECGTPVLPRADSVRKKAP
jgi:predicted RNA-binding Zn-ribbon protein involved in translation (DUF1610 family)